MEDKKKFIRLIIRYSNSMGEDIATKEIEHIIKRIALKWFNIGVVTGVIMFMLTLLL